MPGQTEVNVTVAVEPNNAPQKSFPFVLKKIMDIPPPNILDDGDDEIEKEKLSSSGDGQSRGDGGGGGSGGAGGAGSVSASLTPAIWDKTIPYDGENFHLEYMDLDEFLLENGIPVALEEELQKSLEQERLGNEAPASSKAAPEATEDIEVSTASTTPEVASASPEVAPKLPEEKKKAKEVEKEKEKEEEKEEDCETDVVEEQVTEKATEPRNDLDRVTPSPVNPDDIEVNVNFQPDPTDLVLSSVPGGELFNPRKHRFSEEELKPQPMIKKAKKIFVPEDAKDEKYWVRRKKNNLAAKRSRDARRLKENQIAVRASFLERENAALRQEVAELRKDCSRCKKVVSLYEAKYGPL